MTNLLNPVDQRKIFADHFSQLYNSLDRRARLLEKLFLKHSPYQLYFVNWVFLNELNLRNRDESFYEMYYNVRSIRDSFLDLHLILSGTKTSWATIPDSIEQVFIDSITAIKLYDQLLIEVSENNELNNSDHFRAITDLKEMYLTCFKEGIKTRN